MIPIAELQIGNRVLYNGMEAIVYSIRGPYPDVSERFNNKATVDLYLGGLITATEEDLEPILLTEEVIENIPKLEKIGELNAFNDGGLFKIQLEDDDWNDPAFDVYWNGTYLNCIGFVHELQNTYKTLNREYLLP
jgi:hypothetical protein